MPPRVFLFTNHESFYLDGAASSNISQSCQIKSKAPHWGKSGDYELT
jgi:hypothetical protein